MTDTIMLGAVQAQYKQAEQELRAAAEALKQLEATSRQLAAVRDGLSALKAEVSSGAAALAAASAQFADGAGSVARATEELQQADPVRLTKITETVLAQVQARVDELAAATRAMEVRAEATQGRLLVAVGETSAQVRSDVTASLGATQAAIEQTISEVRQPIGAIERELQELGTRIEGLLTGVRQAVEAAREAHRADLARVTAAIGDAEKAAIARHALLVRELRIGVLLTVGGVALAMWLLRG